MTEADIAKNILLGNTCYNCRKSGIMCTEKDRKNNTCKDWMIFTKLQVVRLGYPDSMQDKVYKVESEKLLEKWSK